MRIGLSSLGVILIVLGAIWFLQGINVLPGSFMTGQIRWANHWRDCVRCGNRTVARRQSARAYRQALESVAGILGANQRL